MGWSSNHSDWSHMWLVVLRNTYVAPCEWDRGSASSLPEPATLQDFGAHQQRKYFSCKEITWSPRLETKKKAVMLKWSVRSSIIWYLSEVSPAWDGATECVSLFEGNVGVWGACLETSPPHTHFQPPSSLSQINPAVCLLIQPVKGWVIHYWIKSASKPFTFQSTGLFPLCWRTPSQRCVL